MPEGATYASILAQTGPRRLQILELIWDRERNVSEIASEVPVSMAAVSQHLSKLKASGLVAVRREGRKRYYIAAPRADDPLGAALEELFGARGEASGPESIAAAEPRPTPPAPFPPVDRIIQHPDARFDEMGGWYRHGLRGRVVALAAARNLLATDVREATLATHRIARSLTRPALAERFPEVDAIARTILSDRFADLAPLMDRLIGALRQASVSEDAADVRILIVEDSRVEASLYSSLVSGPNREVLVAGTAEEARSVLDSTAVSLVILDLGLPGADGRDLLIELGQRPRTAAIPVILLTGRTDVPTQTEAMSLGADAFYAKPVKRAVLSAAVSMMLERAAEARQLGRHDPLTGLRNRTVFLDDVRRLAATAVRARVPLSVAVVEVRGLPVLNDLHGSVAGDTVVRAAASMLRECFRASDLVARWRGNQFAVLFSNAGPDGAAVALGKLRDVTETLSVSLPDDSDHAVIWHAGVASIREPAGVDDALARATRRADVARRSDTPSVVWADTTLEDRTHTVLLVEDDEILADLVHHRLSREGYEVARFGDGSEALAALPNLDASAVVLDTTLPGADGFEILRRLKKSRSLSGVPVIALTFGAEHDTARALRLGANDSLAKPFAVEELMARVGRLIATFVEPER